MAGFSWRLTRTRSKHLMLAGCFLLSVSIAFLGKTDASLFDRFRAVREWSRWLAILALAVGGTIAVQRGLDAWRASPAGTSRIFCAPRSRFA